jgi:hypothetical protein
MNPHTILLPFGLDDELFKSSLHHRIEQANIENIYPKRMWLVAGSGVLLSTFSRIWPKTKFLVVQVGKKIWPDQLGYSFYIFCLPPIFF